MVVVVVVVIRGSSANIPMLGVVLSSNVYVVATVEVVIESTSVIRAAKAFTLSR